MKIFIVLIFLKECIVYDDEIREIFLLSFSDFELLLLGIIVEFVRKKITKLISLKEDDMPSQIRKFSERN